MPAADRIVWIPIAASLNTNAPAVPVPGSLGTMDYTAKAAPAWITVGSAITGKDMKMLKWLKELLTLHQRFADLQKAHDARLMLNRRLAAKNEQLKKEVNKRKIPKGEKALSSAAERHINGIRDAHSLQKARHHIAITRREVIIKKLSTHFSYEYLNQVQAEVAAMSDVEILAYRHPKREATSISN